MTEEQAQSCVGLVISEDKEKDSQHPERVTDWCQRVGSEENATMSQPEVDDPDTPVCSGLMMMNDEMQPPTRARANPRLYDGKTTWREYHSHFQRVSRVNGWSDAQKMDFLWINLTGEALSYVENLTPEQTSSYAGLCQVLEGRFGDQQLSEVFKSELRSRRRKNGESLPALAQEISRLVQRAYPEIGRPGVEELAVEKFREALPDHGQRMAVFQSKAKTLDQAVKAALDTESWQISEARRATTTTKLRSATEGEPEIPSWEEDGIPARAVRMSHPDQGTAWTAAIQKILEEFLQRLPGHGTEPARTREAIKCYYCQKTGHIQ